MVPGKEKELNSVSQPQLKDRPTPTEPPKLEERWQLLMIPTSDLFIDRRYQRGLVKLQVKRLVEGWDWEKYHPIIVSHRADGRYAVISGQQRTTAAIEIGIPMLPALLQKQTDIRDEAKSYLGSGEVATIQPGDRFKARLIANEQKAFDIWNIVNTAGFSLQCLKEEEGTNWADPFSIAAVASLENIYDAGYLPRVLSLIMNTWGDKASKEMVQSPMLRGVYLAMRHLELYEISDEEISKRVGTQEVKSILDKGADRYRSMVVGRSMDVGVAAVLIDAFNYRRREQIPDFNKKSSRAWTTQNLTEEGRRMGLQHQAMNRAKGKTETETETDTETE